MLRILFRIGKLFQDKEYSDKHIRFGMNIVD